jgi:pantoate--beta-alanine ligase
VVIKEKSKLSGLHSLLISIIFAAGDNMKVVYTEKNLSKLTAPARKSGKTIGFVPTMGALHEGHLSLISWCNKQNNITVASIFVNPTQFNDKNDLLNYPRIPEKDLELLRAEKCDIVFMPEEKEIYPEPDTRVFDFGGLDKIMEGEHRPGHFNGVAQVVTRLLDIIKPHRIYFGLKDFQQLAIIKKVIKDDGYPVEIVSCPIVREQDGLAMSSRNMLLSSDERKHAKVISQTLFKAKEMTIDHPVEDIKKYVIGSINTDPLLHIEYFEIVNETTLKPVKSWLEAGNKIGCVAVRIGCARLIDNINFSV